MNYYKKIYSVLVMVVLLTACQTETEVQTASELPRTNEVIVMEDEQATIRNRVAQDSLSSKHLRNLLHVQLHRWDIDRLDLKLYEFEGSYSNVFIEESYNENGEWDNPSLLDCSTSLLDHVIVDDQYNITTEFTRFGIVSYKYDEHNRILKRSVVKEEEYQVGEDYFYNDSNNSVLISYNIKNEVVRTEEIIYNQNGKIDSIISVNDDLQVDFNYEYNEEGFVNAITVKDIVTLKIDYKYNEFNDWTEATVVKLGDGEVILTFKVTREFIN